MGLRDGGPSSQCIWAPDMAFSSSVTEPRSPPQSGAWSEGTGAPGQLWTPGPEATVGGGTVLGGMGKPVKSRGKSV